MMVHKRLQNIRRRNKLIPKIKKLSFDPISDTYPIGFYTPKPYYGITGIKTGCLIILCVFCVENETNGFKCQLPYL